MPLKSKSLLSGNKEELVAYRFVGKGKNKVSFIKQNGLQKYRTGE